MCLLLLTVAFLRLWFLPVTSCSRITLSLTSFLLLTAANQKEPLTPNFKVKEEPKDEEAGSSSVSQPSYVFSQELEAPAPNVPEEKLKPQEAQANVMRQDMSVKAASELLMKLSGKYFI